MPIRETYQVIWWYAWDHISSGTEPQQVVTWLTAMHAQGNTIRGPDTYYPVDCSDLEIEVLVADAAESVHAWHNHGSTLTSMSHNTLDHRVQELLATRQ